MHYHCVKYFSFLFLSGSTPVSAQRYLSLSLSLCLSAPFCRSLTPSTPPPNPPYLPLSISVATSLSFFRPFSQALPAPLCRYLSVCLSVCLSSVSACMYLPFSIVPLPPLSLYMPLYSVLPPPPPNPPDSFHSHCLFVWKRLGDLSMLDGLGNNICIKKKCFMLDHLGNNICIKNDNSVLC